MQYAIEADGLVKRFGATLALDGVSFAVHTGSVLGVLGPNGAGKTTAVRILATLLAADAGSARVAGHDVITEAAEVRRAVGLTGQYASVDETLTGRQNLVMIGQLLDLSSRAARTRAHELLTWFDLTDAADRPARTYSGGMRRRLDLAASLVGRPTVVFLDEPTTGLDPSKREDMWAIVRALVTDGSTVLLTTQYLDEADSLADDIIVIDHGRVIAHDHPDGLKRIVGNQTLTVRPADPGRLDATARVIADVAGATAQVDPGSSVSAAVSGDDAMTATVARLAEAGIAVTELSLALPSLDEVFFTLTGRTAATDDLQEGGMNTPASATVAGVLPVAARSPRRRWPLLRHSLVLAKRRLINTRPHAGGADRRHPAADHLPVDVHLHLRRGDLARLDPPVPAVPAARDPGPDDRDGRGRHRGEPQQRRDQGDLRPVSQPAHRPRRPRSSAPCWPTWCATRSCASSRSGSATCWDSAPTPACPRCWRPAACRSSLPCA